MSQFTVEPELGMYFVIHGWNTDYNFLSFCEPLKVSRPLAIPAIYSLFLNPSEAVYKLLHYHSEILPLLILIEIYKKVSDV